LTMILDDPNDRALNGLQTQSSQLYKNFQPDIQQPSPPPYSSITPVSPQRILRSRERRPTKRERRPMTQFLPKSLVTYAASISVLLNCLLIALLIRVSYRVADSGDSVASAHVYYATEYVGRELNSTSYSKRGGGGLGAGRTHEGRGSSPGGQRHRSRNNDR